MGLSNQPKQSKNARAAQSRCGIQFFTGTWFDKIFTDGRL
jgi:hypothetical protein